MNTTTATVLSAAEELRATLRDAYASHSAEPRYTVFERTMLTAASMFGSSAREQMQYTISQRYIPGVIADLDRLARDLRREIGNGAACGMLSAACGHNGHENDTDVQSGTAEVYMI